MNLLALSGCTGGTPPQETTRAIRIMTPQAPATLNPRATLDSSSQWLAALVFRGLTRLDPDLKPQPDLASAWKSNPGGDLWVFEVGPQQDHLGNPITTQLIARCLQNYQGGNPKSPLRTLLPHWKSARAIDEKQIEIRLDRPDPYLPQTLTAFRYFSPDGNPEPCTEPNAGQKLVGNGAYRPEPWDANPKERLRLVALHPGSPDLHFTFVQDDNTRVLKLLRGEVDATLNGISISKTRWLQESHSDRFNLIHRTGARVSYLAFNLRDRILGKRDVRQAIAHAIDRAAILQSKLGSFGAPAGSLLSPLLSENRQAQFHYDPKEGNRLLDSAGYPRGKNGVRFRLAYKTTPVREGLETGMIVSEMLRKVGIQVDLEIVEPAVFFAAIRQNAFQLYSSRWLGITDGSILFRTLRSGHPSNRSGYANAELDQLLDSAVAELNPEKRKELFGRVQDRAAKDLPFLPLWYWNNTLILKKGMRPVDANSISLNGSFDVFSELKEPLQ